MYMYILSMCNEAGLAVWASVVPRGERFHVNTLKDHVWGTLLPSLKDPCQFYLVLPAVEVFQQVPAYYEGQRVAGRGTVLVLTRCYTHVQGRCQPKWKCAKNSICADVFSPIAVMHLYECISGNKSRACSLAWIAKRQSCNLKLLSLLQLLYLLYCQFQD